MANPKQTTLWVTLNDEDCRHDLLISVRCEDIDDEEMELAADATRQRLLALFLEEVLSTYCKNEHHLHFRAQSEITPLGKLEECPEEECPIWVVRLSRVARSGFACGLASNAATFRAALLASGRVPEENIVWPPEQVMAFVLTEKDLEQAEEQADPNSPG